MISIDQAQKLILDNVAPAALESINIVDASGRVIAEDVYSDRDYPPFNRSAVDGYGINSADFLERRLKEYSLVGELMAGSEFSRPLKSKECVKIMTGASVPASVDAVIKVEDCVTDGGTIELKVESIKKFLNIAVKGEDTKASELIIAKGTLLTPLHLSILAATGKSQVKIYKVLSIAVISTGDELKAPGENVKDYQIRDSNSYALQGFLDFYRIPIAAREIASDDPESLRRTFDNASRSDIVIFTGGVSMGDADFVPSVLKKAGVNEIFHKVKIRPGKPIWFGVKGKQVVFGLPGNPLSVMVGFKIFIEPYLRQAMGMLPQPSFRFPLESNKQKKVKLDEYFTCRFSTSGEQSKLEIVRSNGSGDFTSVLQSDGIALHSLDSMDLKRDDLVDFIFWRSIR